jgi:predicted transcriptional regulator
MLGIKRKKKSTKCNFSVSVSKETRLAADQLGQKLDRSRSKIIEMGIKALQSQKI